MLLATVLLVLAATTTGPPVLITDLPLAALVAVAVVAAAPTGTP